MNTGKTYTTEEFVKMAVAKHGTRYEYALTEYRGKNHKVVIVCKIHGAFEQKPYSHLNTTGCGKCRATATGLSQRKTHTEFTAEAEAAHGVGTYDYSRAVYAGKGAKLTIICPTHGPFEQQAGMHIKGQNCPKCADRTSNAARFTEGSRKVHGEKYDYSRVSYVNGATKVIIICPTHGPFEQKPNSHLGGSGCWPCANERIREGWVTRAAGRECTLYLVRFYDKAEQFFKVGITYRGVKARFATANLRGYKRETLATCHSFDAARIFDWERSIIKTFAHLRHRPRKGFDGETECFSSADEILAIFPL